METILNWFTGADARAAAVRSITTVLTTAIAVFTFMKWDPTFLQGLLPQVGPIVSAAFLLIAALVEAYRVIYKTSSNKGMDAAHAVDKAVASGELGKADPVVIKTPDPAKPDISVPAR